MKWVAGLLAVLLVVQVAGLTRRGTAVSRDDDRQDTTASRAGAADQSKPADPVEALRAYELALRTGAADPFASGRRPAAGQIRKRNVRPKRSASVTAADKRQDPLLIEAEWRSRRFALRREFTPFFLAERLPAAQVERTLDLLADLEMGRSYAAQLAYDPAKPDRTAVVQDLATRDLRAALEQELGPERAAKAEAFRVTAPVRRDVELLAQELAGGGLALEASTAAAVQELMVRGWTAGAKPPYAREQILAEASRRLTPRQLEQLDELLRRRNHVEEPAHRP